MPTMTRRRSFLQRPKGQDGVIGWVSFSDTLFLGFALLLLCSMKLASTLKERDAEISQFQSIAALEPSTQQERLRTLIAAADDLQAQLHARSAELHTTRAELRELKDLVAKRAGQENGATDRATQQARLRRLSELADDLKTQLHTRMDELAAVRAELKVLKDNTKQRVTQEKRVRHELLGLKGKLRRVALVIDSSQSMKSGDRWAKALEMVQQWVECLDMQACVVVVFHSYVYRYPKVGEFDFTTNREKAIASIREHLARFKPNGRTDTLAALEEAYGMDNLDTIILFTDGSPNTDDKPGSDKELVDRIYELCRSKPDIPINAIGIGDYFKPEFSKFLLSIAEMTGGTFIGR